MSTECGLCVKSTQIKCFYCILIYHVKCSKISTKQYTELITSGTEWFCDECNQIDFPFANLKNDDIVELYNTCNDQALKPNKTTMCGFAIKSLQKIYLMLYAIYVQN